MVSEKLKMIEMEVDKCYQCGTCTGDCPVAKIDDSFNPRKIVLATNNDKIMNSDILWKCAACFKCYRCPRDVKPAEVLGELRKELVKEGEVPKMAEAFTKLVRDYGELPESKLVFAVKGLSIINMIPFELVLRMFKVGKVKFWVRKSSSAKEVKRIFEITGANNGKRD